MIHRRTFLRSAAGAAALAAHAKPARARSSIGKLRTAHVGVGGMGASDLRALSSHPQIEVFALCDVDRQRLDAAQQKFPQAQVFRDYRDMIASLSETVDAVVVSTPDHSHAPAAMTAMNHDKPVYCQKPLAHEVFEVRRLREVAAEKQLVTQMGIQRHASEAYRRATEMIQSGVIGRISEVHAWSHKIWGYEGGPFVGTHPVPDDLDWNLWIGTARMRPYQPDVYHPRNWRRLVDFGTGTLGDMGVHIFDTPYRALQLTAQPGCKRVAVRPTGVGYPERNRVRYEFPETPYTTESLALVWYDGPNVPPDANSLELPEGVQLPSQGALFVGAAGWMLLPHVGEPVLLPEAQFAEVKRPEMPPADHYHEWVEACLTQSPTSAHFGYAGPLTEAVLLGVVANRFPDERLRWDAEAMRFTNQSDATALLQRTYRATFEIDNLNPR